MHGRERVDDYAWLAERGDDATIAYLEAENAYAEASLAHLTELEEAIYQEALARLKQTDLTVPVRLDDFYYYSRTEEGQQYPIYCRKKGDPEAADEEVLLDVNELAADSEYLRLGALEVSPDHRRLAICVDGSGSESFELRVRDLETGDWLEDSLQGLAGSIAWASDNRTLFYTTLDATKRPYKVLRHRLGDDTGDGVVFREDDEAFFVSVERTRSGERLLVTSASAVTSEVWQVPSEIPEAEARCIEPRRPGVEYYVDHRRDAFYLLVNCESDGSKAENFRLVRRPVDGTADDDRELVAHRTSTKLEAVDLFEGHLVLWQRRDGLIELLVHTCDDGGEISTGRAIQMPESVYTVRRDSNPAFDAGSFRFGYCSLVTPMTIFSCDMETLDLTVLKVQEVLGGYDASRYVTRRLVAESDGVSVPISIVHRADLPIDGRAPCLLHGYGAYGTVIDPVFSSVLVSLLDRGFVYAIAHVRGGGLLGKAWHEGGRMLSKRNTFLDVIAAAEHLVESGYSHPERLAIRGGSAGGLLVGAAVNMRPDLFAAAVARVPFVDVVNTMLDRSIPLTVIEFEEWGNPQDEEYFDYLLSYSPYDNVEAQDYPAMLVTAGLNDPRVQYWEPAKWVARLRVTKTDENLLVLRTYMGAGHAGPSGRYQMLRERAQEYSFLLDALGMADNGTGEEPDRP